MTKGIIWVALVICAAAALIVLVFQDRPGTALALGCVALVLAIIGVSGRNRAPHSE